MAEHFTYNPKIECSNPAAHAVKEQPLAQYHKVEPVAALSQYERQDLNTQSSDYK